jgi:hypothetical protein
MGYGDTKMDFLQNVTLAFHACHFLGYDGS